jgi:hypothetical protein
MTPVRFLMLQVPCTHGNTNPVYDRTRTFRWRWLARLCAFIWRSTPPTGLATSIIVFDAEVK